MSCTTTQPFIFSQLPTELLREIFEYAACDTKMALQLSLVSPWARHWIEPFLYHTVVLSTAPALRSFVYALEQKQPAFAHDRVKHLGIFAHGPIQAIEHVLDACTGIDSLACGFTLASSKQLYLHGTIQAPDCPKEQHLLGLACRDGWDTTVVGPAVTRLRVHLSSSPNALPPFALPSDDADKAVGWDVLSNLQALTHLAVVYRPSQSYPITALFVDLQHLLHPTYLDKTIERAHPEIQLILVQVVGLPSAQMSAVGTLNTAALEAGGSSLKIVAERAPSSPVVQWEDSARTGKSVWQGAEEVVKDRVTQEAKRKVDTAPI
ncbi:unnamed protein product [Somion occarium]